MASLVIATVILIASVAVVVFGPGDRVTVLSVILGVAALAAGVLIVGEPGRWGVSAAFIVATLAAAFLGPGSAALAALISELSAATRMRTQLRWVLLNLPVCIGSAVLAAVIVRGIESRPLNTAAFYAAVVVAALVSYLVSFAILALLYRLNRPDEAGLGVAQLTENLPSAALSVALVVAGVAITLIVGNAGIAFALAAVFAFSYMVHLVDKARHRAEQHASLSWGVLAGLMRALDIRDGRAARHSAAVARFARDIAREMGMTDVECELAHTAGLLHDIGRFALSDRVAERDRVLTEEDWMAIQRHPELGADMLRDLGMYGPVPDIILAHHERIDGRGYPRGLTGDEIPEIAKIISVAEVYDTLTASDTYRTQMSSFEALNELRRVAGTQLDARYVEILAGLFTGEGVEYRHADMADFDIELNMERRIREAAAGG